MSVPAWFSDEAYVANKLLQLQAAEPEVGWTSESLRAAFTAAGYGNDADGMYRHFVEWGNAENVSPSPWFVVSEYMANKLAQLQRDEPAAGWDMAKVEQAFKDAGLSAWDHYTLYGQAEGISPSSLFDTDAYLSAKLAQLQRDEPNAGWASVAQVVKAFQANGLNPIEHYLLFGTNEDLSYAPAETVAPEKPVSPHYPFYSSNNETPSHTPVEPVEPVKPVIDLTTERDVLNLDTGDHVINGVASPLDAENTLNENDLIDGGEGNDTLRVTMNANFNGFTVIDDPDTTGGMKNVENVELINNGSLARTFSAKGIEGATTYTLKAGDADTGALNLTDLAAAGITVNVDGLKSGTTKVEFAADALTGTADSLTLGLTNTGTAPDAAVNVSTSIGLESVTINASGPNHVDLSGVDAPSFTVNVLDSEAAANTFDGITANTLTFIGGLGADRVSLTAKDGTAITATLDTGAGNDTVTIDGIPSTETITVSGDMGGDANDAITIDASDATDHDVTIDISKLRGYATSDITGVDNQSDTIIGGSGDDTIRAVTFATPAIPGTTLYSPQLLANLLNMLKESSDTPTLQFVIGCIRSDPLPAASFESVDGLARAINNDLQLNPYITAKVTGDNTLCVTEKAEHAGKIFINEWDFNLQVIIGLGGDTVYEIKSIGGSLAVPATAVCDTLTGGDGADHFILSVADASTDTTVGPTAVITDFDADEGDRLTIGNLGEGSSTNYYAEVERVYENFGMLLTVAAGKLNDTTSYVAAMVGNDTYIVAGDDSGHQAIVQLQGVSLGQLSDDGSFITAA